MISIVVMLAAGLVFFQGGMAGTGLVWTQSNQRVELAPFYKDIQNRIVWVEPGTDSEIWLQLTNFVKIFQNILDFGGKFMFNSSNFSSWCSHPRVFLPHSWDPGTG